MISILLSCYKSNLEYLKEQIDSIINQTEEDWELLVYDDGSEFLKEFLSEYNDKRIKYFNNGQKGYAKAYNFLLSKAKGKYVCFCDHDDIWVEDKLEIEKKYLDEHPEVDCVFGWLHWFGEKEKLETFDISDEEISKELPFWQPIKQPTAMFRKERFGEFDSPYDIAGDYWFWSKHWNRNYHLIPTVLAHYRRHAGEQTKDRVGFRETTAKIIQTRMKERFGVEPSMNICKMLDKYSQTYNEELKQFIKEII